MALTAKQARFCEEYIKDLNATQAAIRAGYSEKTAKEQAARLLTNVNVQTKISELQGKRSKRTAIEADQVLKELACIGFSDPRSILDKSGQFLPVKDWPDDIAAAISAIDMDAGQQGVLRIKKIRFWNKNNALEQLGKHLGLYKDNGQDGELPDPVNIHFHVRKPGD